MDWKKPASSLPHGKSKKVKHCGDSKSMIVSNSRTGIRAHCFRCGFSEFEHHGYRSIDSIVDMHKELQQEVEKVAITLPKDFTNDIPDDVVWLSKYGISRREAELFNIGWSDKYRRVIIPVTDPFTFELTAVVARSLSEFVKPKYLNYGASDSVFFADNYGSKHTVVTEDVLSAIKIWLAGYSAVALLGSSAMKEKVIKLADIAPNGLVIWLDGDKAGRKGSESLASILGLMDVPTLSVTTPKDPKEYSRYTIRDLINTTLEDNEWQL